jgi:hypothetical protein
LTRKTHLLARTAASAILAQPPETGPALDLPPVVVTEDEAATLLRMCRRSLQDLRLKGGGPVFCRLIGRRVGYRIADLDAWARARSATSTSAEAGR